MWVTEIHNSSTGNWSQGLKFVEWNLHLWPIYQEDPNEALFGSGLEFGISATSLPKDVVDTMTVEESWKKVWRWWTV
jgi:hypothetical protein